MNRQDFASLIALLNQRNVNHEAAINITKAYNLNIVNHKLQIIPLPPKRKDKYHV